MHGTWILRLLLCGAVFVAAVGRVAAVDSAENRRDAVPILSAETILASQPADLVERLTEKNVLVMQEVREEGPMRGAIVSTYVLFEKPIDDVYALLAQSERQVEFRPELKSVVTVEQGPRGPVDEQRLRILFQRYVYRLIYELFPERRRIEWLLDERFDNDLAKVSGFWQLYEMKDGGTLGRSGTSVDVGPAVPAFLQDWITRKNLPRTMERVRLWVNSDGEDRL